MSRFPVPAEFLPRRRDMSTTASVFDTILARATAFVAEGEFSMPQVAEALLRGGIARVRNHVVKAGWLAAGGDDRIAMTRYKLSQDQVDSILTRVRPVSKGSSCFLGDVGQMPICHVAAVTMRDDAVNLKDACALINWFKSIGMRAVVKMMRERGPLNVVQDFKREFVEATMHVCRVRERSRLWADRAMAVVNECLKEYTVIVKADGTVFRPSFWGVWVVDAMAACAEVSPTMARWLLQKTAETAAEQAWTTLLVQAINKMAPDGRNLLGRVLDTEVGLATWARKERKQLILHLLEMEGVDADRVTATGDSAMSVAAANIDTTLLHAVLKHMPAGFLPPRRWEGSCYGPPLTAALLVGRSPFVCNGDRARLQNVQELLAHGENPLDSDASGLTPLAWTLVLDFAPEAGAMIKRLKRKDRLLAAEMLRGLLASGRLPVHGAAMVVQHHHRRLAELALEASPDAALAPTAGPDADGFEALPVFAEGGRAPRTRKTAAEHAIDLAHSVAEQGHCGDLIELLAAAAERTAALKVAATARPLCNSWTCENPSCLHAHAEGHGESALQAFQHRVDFTLLLSASVFEHDNALPCLTAAAVHGLECGFKTSLYLRWDAWQRRKAAVVEINIDALLVEHPAGAKRARLG